MNARAQTTAAAQYAMSQRSALKSYYRALREIPTVRAGLKAIQSAEGTARYSNPYSVGFGGRQIGLDKHPGTAHSFTQTNGKKNKTTAAGAYQFLSKTWRNQARKLGLSDFGPESQDIAALSLIDQAGALGDLIAGNIQSFVSKVNGIWASLPGAPYPQPTRSMSFVERAFQKALNDPLTLPDNPPIPPQRYQPIAASVAPPTPQSIQTAMGLANIQNRTPAPQPLTAAPAGTVERAPLPPARQVSPPALATTNLPGTPYDVQKQQPARPVTPTPVSAPAVPAGQVTRAPLPPERPAFTPPARPVTPTPPAALAAMTAPVTTAGIPPAPSLMSPELMGPEQTFAQQPVQPTFVPAVPQEVQPPVAPPPVAPPPVKPPSVRVAEAHAASSFPAAPKMPSAADVYDGRASVGVASDGSMVSRNSYGGVSITNKYGATTTMTPSGQMAVSYGGPPSVANPGIEGPLGSPGITTPKQGGGLFGIQPAKTETGNLARGVLGSMAGSAIGSLAGPVGSLVGAAIGRSIAQGRNPFDALTGNRGDFVTYQSQAFGPIRAVAPNLSGAMGVFPGAPTGVRGALGGNQSNNSMAGMRSISPGAASAISRGQGGLY